MTELPAKAFTTVVLAAALGTMLASSPGRKLLLGNKDCGTFSTLFPWFTLPTVWNRGAKVDKFPNGGILETVNSLDSSEARDATARAFVG